MSKSKSLNPFVCVCFGFAGDDVREKKPDPSIYITAAEVRGYINPRKRNFILT